MSRFDEALLASCSSWCRRAADQLALARDDARVRDPDRPTGSLTAIPEEAFLTSPSESCDETRAVFDWICVEPHAAR